VDGLTYIERKYAPGIPRMVELI